MTTSPLSSEEFIKNAGIELAKDSSGYTNVKLKDGRTFQLYITVDGKEDADLSKSEALCNDVAKIAIDILRKEGLIELGSNKLGKHVKIIDKKITIINGERETSSTEAKSTVSDFKALAARINKDFNPTISRSGKTSSAEKPKKAEKKSEPDSDKFIKLGDANSRNKHLDKAKFISKMGNIISSVEIKDKPAVSISDRLFKKFEIAGKTYQEVTTAGDGACAIHALIGKEESGVIIYSNNALSPNSQTAAKMEYLKELQVKNFSNSLVNNKLIFHFENLLNEKIRDFSYPGNPHTEANKLFQDFPIETFLNQRNELYAKEIEKRNERSDAIWKFIEKNKDTSKGKGLLKIFRSNIGAFKKEDQKSVLSILDSDPIDVEKLKGLSGNFINNQFREFTDPELSEIIKPLQDEYLKIHEEVQNFNSMVVLEHYEQIIKRYEEVIKDPDYYLSDQEMEIAAYLFDKKVILVAPGANEDRKLRNQVYNPDAKGETVVVYQQDRHYRRCFIPSS